MCIKMKLVLFNQKVALIIVGDPTSTRAVSYTHLTLPTNREV